MTRDGLQKDCFNLAEHCKDSVQRDKIIYDKMKMDYRHAVMRYQMDFVLTLQRAVHSVVR